MLKKSILSVFVLLIAATLSFSEQPQTAPAPTGAPAQNSQVRGVVNKIDMQTKIITIRDEATGQTQEISFDERTAFSKQSGKGAATDILQDDRVTVEVDSTNTAVSVTVEPKQSVATSETQENS